MACYPGYLVLANLLQRLPRRGITLESKAHTMNTSSAYLIWSWLRRPFCDSKGFVVEYIFVVPVR